MNFRVLLLLFVISPFLCADCKYCSPKIKAQASAVDQYSVLFGTEYFKHGDMVQSVAITPNGEYFISGEATSIVIWNASSGKKLNTFTKMVNTVVAMAVAPDSKTIAVEGAC